MHLQFLIPLFLLLASCASREISYEQDSVAHYASKHSKKEGWELESIEKFDLGTHKGAFFEAVYYEEQNLGVSHMRNLLVGHIVRFLHDNQNNHKLIKSVQSKEKGLSYHNLSIDLTFYAKKKNKSNGPQAFLNYRDETVRYWIFNPLISKYDLVHEEKIHDALSLSPVCSDKGMIDERPSSKSELL